MYSCTGNGTVPNTSRACTLYSMLQAGSEVATVIRKFQFAGMHVGRIGLYQRLYRYWMLALNLKHARQQLPNWSRSITPSVLNILICTALSLAEVSILTHKVFLP